MTGLFGYEWGKATIPLLLISILLSGILLGATRISNNPKYIVSFGFIIAGVLCYIIGFNVNSDPYEDDSKPDYKLEKKRRLFHNTETTFYIPIQHWLWIFLICAIISVLFIGNSYSRLL